MSRLGAGSGGPGRRALALSAIALSLLAGCGSASSGASDGGPLAVAAAENVWGNIAAQIGGSHVSVTSIITDPNMDPHTYETGPRAAAALSGASFVIENGAGYDDFVDKVLGTDPNPSRDVLDIATAVGARGDNPNPHFWYDPGYVTEAAHAIESHLARHDPKAAPAFADGLQAFLTAYQPYLDTLQAIRSKHAGTPMAYTERVPGYLVARAGLRLATPASFAQAIEDGNDPSPGDVAAMDSAMTGKLVQLLLYNSQVTGPATQRVRALATANGIPVVGVAETIPSGARSFQSWQIGQARAILAALGG